MPFKLKLKKSRQYNVSSKSLFVISVHHLLVFDTPTTVDCTLSSESTGLECLSNVCQRLSINQLEFFGLRYVVKGSTKNDGEELRWVDLERPLSRQLDKYAASPRLYLRVMYYVISGVSLINDEVTRNYYFLQLKSDIVEGRISCDPKQAVILAMYCRQAQYDSHQNERHTVEYLKNLLPFPPSVFEAGHSLETLTEAVLQPNAEIQNLTQAMAEGLFITACQQLDGYGQEKFDAKDDCNVEVTLGITVSGIAVSANENSKFYPWHDISNVVNHKRTFNIECTEPDKSVGFNLTDTETGRYFWKLCVLQHTFYIKYEKNQNHSSPEGNFNIFQNLPDDLTESRDNLFVEQPNLYASDSHISTGNWQTDSVVSSNMSLAQSQQQIKQQFNQNWVTPMTPSDNFNGHNSNWGLVGSNASLNNRAQSSSCLDLSNNNISSHDKERLKAFLPGYRSAPDYETAVQQKKYRASESELRVNNMVHVQPSGIVSDSHINNYSGSQPDVHRVTAVADAIFGQQLQYPDVTQTTNSVYQQHFDPNVIRLDGLSQQLQMMRFNKPPPPYPANRLSSTSTPDLALASHRALCYQAYVSGSSPDLVSTRTFLNSQYQGPQQPTIPSNTFRYRYSQSHIPHGTYENLNFLENQTKTNILTQKIQKAYDGAYRVSNQQQQQQQQQGLIGSHQLNGSIEPIEPIYENVPLPNPTDTTSNEMRDRASSVQSAPGVMRFKQQQPAQQHQHQSNQTQHQSQQQQPQQPTLTDTHNFNVTKPAIFFDRQPEHIPVTKAQSNPIVVQHQVIQNAQSHHDITDSSHPTISMHQQQQQQQPTSRQSSTPIEQSSRLNRSYAQLDSLNRSQSTNVLDSSQSSSYTNTTTTTDSGINCSSEHRGSKEKKKRRWNFWGGGSKGSLSDKQKSATLGRDKEKSNKNALTKDEESNLRHRWSTGLPRLPLLATISKEKLCQILETKLSDPQLYVEFERIPKRKENARYDCALHEENRMKNFDPNFLPYDDNRVRLTPTRENRLGYYNASHITATVGSKQRFYIVAQSPNAVPALNTFFQCVWEADVYLLVQLSDEVNYVPPTSDKCLEYGQYQIWQEFSQVTDRCITSKLRIYHTQSRRYRSVWHLRYCEWVEQNCPKDVGQFLEFLEELSSVRLASINEVPPGHNTNPPVMIHCNEGGGRAGVTLSADLLLYTLDHNQDLDIPRVLNQLRQQRDNIVPSLAQYKFVYALLINYLKRTRLI